MSILHWAHLRGFASPDLFWSHWIKFSRGPRSKETSWFKSMFIGKAKCLHSILVSLIFCNLAYGIIAFWLAGGSAYAKFWLNESFVSILTSDVGVRSPKCPRLHLKHFMNDCPNNKNYSIIRTNRLSHAWIFCVALSIALLSRINFCLLDLIHETKTKVITPASHKGYRQYSESIKTRSNYRMYLKQNAGKRVRMSHDWFCI